MSLEPLDWTVLVAVYIKVPVEQFQAAIQSLRDQTRPAREIIVVADGPVAPAVDEYLADPANADLRVIRLPENRGLAVARRAGFAAATYRWVAMQDSDDISLPRRFELTARKVETGRYAAVGGQMYEFLGDPSNRVGIRTMPVEDAAIRRALKFNSALNNPTAVLDRDAVAAVGGLQEILYMEDFDLSARLVGAGYVLGNIPEAVVDFRLDDGVYARRRDRRLFAVEWEMAKRLHRYGLISKPRILFNFVARSAFRLLPTWLFSRVHARLFRRPV